MVSLSKGITAKEARAKVVETLENGNAFKTFKDWISYQHGDFNVLDDLDEFTKATYKTELLSPCDGYISSSEASGIGIAAMMLGAGRSSKEDAIATAKADPKIAEQIEGKTIVKEISVPGKIVNIVVR